MASVFHKRLDFCAAFEAIRAGVLRSSAILTKRMKFSGQKTCVGKRLSCSDKPGDVRHKSPAYYRAFAAFASVTLSGLLTSLDCVGELRYFVIRTPEFEHRYICDIGNRKNPGSGTWAVLAGLYHGFALHESLQESVANLLARLLSIVSQLVR